MQGKQSPVCAAHCHIPHRPRTFICLKHEALTIHPTFLPQFRPTAPKQAEAQRQGSAPVFRSGGRERGTSLATPNGDPSNLSVSHASKFMFFRFLLRFCARQSEKGVEHATNAHKRKCKNTGFLYHSSMSCIMHLRIKLYKHRDKSVSRLC